MVENNSSKDTPSRPFTLQSVMAARVRSFPPLTEPNPRSNSPSRRRLVEIIEEVLRVVQDDEDVPSSTEGGEEEPRGGEPNSS